MWVIAFLLTLPSHFSFKQSTLPFSSVVGPRSYKWPLTPFLLGTALITLTGWQNEDMKPEGLVGKRKDQ